MQILLDEQLRKKLTSHEQEEKKRINNGVALSPNDSHAKNIKNTTFTSKRKLLRIWK